MSNPLLSIDRHDLKESSRAIQEAQNTAMGTGAAATLALIRELLKSLRLPEKPVKVEISINDSVAYQANAQVGQNLEGNTEAMALSDQQLRYLKEVVKLPQSNSPANAAIALDQDVTITIDGQEVFRLKDGIVENNFLAPSTEQVQENPLQQEENAAQEAQVEIVTEDSPELTEQPSIPVVMSAEATENAIQEAQVEIVAEDSPELIQTGVSLSSDQRQDLEKLGVNPQMVENALGQKAQSAVPIIVVLNREVDRTVTRSSLKTNLKSIQSRIQKAVKDFSRKISSFLGSAREKLFPTTDRAVKKELENLAVINVAARLLDRFGNQSPDGKQVFEGNTFRLERQDNNVTVTAKDGRGAIASLKEGQLNGDLTPKDVEKFQAVDRQLNQGQSRQFQAEMG